MANKAPILQKPVARKAQDEIRLVGKRKEVPPPQYGGWTDQEHFAFIEGNFCLFLNVGTWKVAAGLRNIC